MEKVKAWFRNNNIPELNRKFLEHINDNIGNTGLNTVNIESALDKKLLSIEKSIQTELDKIDDEN